MENESRDIPYAYTRRKLVHFNLGHRDSHPRKCINKSIWLATGGGHLPWVHHGYLPGANQIDLLMHFLGASCDALVTRRVDLDTISSSVYIYLPKKACRWRFNVLPND